MVDGNDKQQLLYFIELELLRQGDRIDAEKLASRISDPTLKLSAEEESKFASGYDWRIPAPPPPPLKGESVRSDYSEALIELRAGKVREAIRCVQTNENPADVSSHLARLASAAAEMGNLEGALAIAAKTKVTGAEYEEGYLVEALPSIGKLWAERDPVKALQWARQRPDAYQQSMALIGVAEGSVTTK